MAISVERAARTQVLFREVNERIARLTRPMLEEGGRLFVCECSLEGCAEAIEVTMAEYEAVRARGARFVITPGHELNAIERVVDENIRYAVVEKLADAAAIASDNEPRRG